MGADRPGPTPAPSTSPRRPDLLDTFFLLARVKTALCAEVDDSLRAAHGISLEVLDALSLVAERREGCPQATLAFALGLSADETVALVDGLVAAAYVRRPEWPGGEPCAIQLTLRGRLLHVRACQTLDRELDRRIGSRLSPRDITRSAEALAGLRWSPERQRSGPSHVGSDARPDPRPRGTIAIRCFPGSILERSRPE